MKLNFDISLKKIILEELRGRNPVPDILGFLNVRALFGHDFSSNLGILFKEYEKGTRNPKPLLKIDAPKANFTIRPMARPWVQDWLIYEAIVDYLSKEILKNREICKRSFSILRFKLGDATVTEPFQKFEDRSREFYEKGYKYAVKADLTGYYENISLGELRSRVNNYLERDQNGERLTAALFNMLNKWSDERIPGYGLSQGPPGSSFLADIFLDCVDRKMEEYKGYFRYMDDIRIFCRKPIDAKVALRDLTIALREVKLNINAKKTEVLMEREIEKLFDPRKLQLNMIDKLMRSKDRKLIEKIVIPALIELFHASFLNDPFEKTHLNFALYRLRVLHNSGFRFLTEEIIKGIKENFVSKPHHTGLFCSFLSMFPKNKDIVRFLIRFLKSEDNIYEWQELKILQAVLKFSVKFNRSEICFFIKSARDSNKHFGVRAFYFMLAGKYGDNRDRDLIVDCYNNKYEIYLKMGIILAVQELGKGARKRFFSRVKGHEDSEMDRFITYVKSLSRPIYFIETKLPKIETYRELETSSYEYA